MPRPARGERGLPGGALSWRGARCEVQGPDPGAVAQGARLGGHDRGRRRARAGLRGRSGEAVSDPVGVDGADAPLRPARGRVPGPLLRPRDRLRALLPRLRPPARADRRLQRSRSRGSPLRRRRHLREAADRAAGQHDPRGRPEPPLDRRQGASRALRLGRRPRAGSLLSRPHLARARGVVLHARRQPRQLVRFARLGRGRSAPAWSARWSPTTGRRRASISGAHRPGPLAGV